MTIGATFEVSYQDLSCELQRVFRALVVFPASFGAEAAEAVCVTRGHESLSELVRRSMVLYDEVADRYRLHDLVRDFASSKLPADSEERIEAELSHAEHYKNVLAAADELYLKGGDSVMAGLKQFDAEWANIQEGQAWAVERRRERTVDKRLARLVYEFPDAGVYCLALRLPANTRIAWLDSALAAARNLGDRQGEGSALGNLGLAYNNLDEYRKAIEFHEQYLVIAREIGDRRGEGNALGNLGNAYSSLGEYRKAIEYHERALEISRAIEYRRAEGQDLGNLGLAYYSLGEYRKAIEFQEQHLDIAREIGDRRGEGAALGNLGNAYSNLGEYRKAIEFYEQHRAIAREIGDRRGEGNALWNRALALRKVGRKAEAIADAEASLRIFEQIEAPHAAMVRDGLASWRAE